MYNNDMEKKDLKFIKCQKLCTKYNQLPFSESEKKDKLIHKIIKEIKGKMTLQTPFYCDYGFNITIGNDFFANAELTLHDKGEIIFGDNVVVGQKCTFIAEKDKPIHICDDVWFGTNVCVMPNVTIGIGAIISANSVVTHDIPEGAVASGNPCEPAFSFEKLDVD